MKKVSRNFFVKKSRTQLSLSLFFSTHAYPDYPAVSALRCARYELTLNLLTLICRSSAMGKAIAFLDRAFVPARDDARLTHRTMMTREHSSASRNDTPGDAICIVCARRYDFRISATAKEGLTQREIQFFAEISGIAPSNDQCVER